MKMKEEKKEGFKKKTDAIFKGKRTLIGERIGITFGSAHIVQVVRLFILYSFDSPVV